MGTVHSRCDDANCFAAGPTVRDKIHEISNRAPSQRELYRILKKDDEKSDTESDEVIGVNETPAAAAVAASVAVSTTLSDPVDGSSCPSQLTSIISRRQSDDLVVEQRRVVNLLDSSTCRSNGKSMTTTAFAHSLMLKNLLSGDSNIVVDRVAMPPPDCGSDSGATVLRAHSPKKRILKLTPDDEVRYSITTDQKPNEDEKQHQSQQMQHLFQQKQQQQQQQYLNFLTEEQADRRLSNNNSSNVMSFKDMFKTQEERYNGCLENASLSLPPLLPIPPHNFILPPVSRYDITSSNISKLLQSCNEKTQQQQMTNTSTSGCTQQQMAVSRNGFEEFVTFHSDTKQTVSLNTVSQPSLQFPVRPVNVNVPAVQKLSADISRDLVTKFSTCSVPPTTLQTIVTSERRMLNHSSDIPLDLSAKTFSQDCSQSLAQVQLRNNQQTTAELDIPNNFIQRQQRSSPDPFFLKVHPPNLSAIKPCDIPHSLFNLTKVESSQQCLYNASSLSNINNMPSGHYYQNADSLFLNRGRFDYTQLEFSNNRQKDIHNFERINGSSYTTNNIDKASNKERYNKPSPMPAETQSQKPISVLRQLPPNGDGSIKTTALQKEQSYLSQAKHSPPVHNYNSQLMDSCKSLDVHSMKKILQVEPYCVQEHLGHYAFKTREMTLPSSTREKSLFDLPVLSSLQSSFTVMPSTLANEKNSEMLSFHKLGNWTYLNSEQNSTQLADKPNINQSNKRHVTDKSCVISSSANQFALLNGEESVSQIREMSPIKEMSPLKEMSLMKEDIFHKQITRNLEPNSEYVINDSIKDYQQVPSVSPKSKTPDSQNSVQNSVKSHASSTTFPNPKRRWLAAASEMEDTDRKAKRACVTDSDFSTAFLGSNGCVVTTLREEKAASEDLETIVSQHMAMSNILPAARSGYTLNDIITRSIADQLSNCMNRAKPVN